MPLKWRKKVILAKTETVYGTDPVPTGAANAIMISDVTINPLEGDNASRGLVRDTLGSEPTIPVGTHVSCEFSVEIAGAGAAGTAPAYGPLLRACAMAETITALTDVQYDPVSSGEESATLYFNNDGNLHPLLGARGNVTIELAANQIPHFKFRFIGLWSDPVAAALPTPDFTAFTTPIPVNNANTPTFTVHGYSGVMANVKFDLGNVVKHRDLVNSESVNFGDREAKGSTSFEAPALGTKNFFTIAKAATLDAVQVVHGLTAGNIVQFDAPKVQIQSPKYSESDGISMLDMSLNVTPNTGDDELKITVK
ncbi:phage tail tube protein [Magnetovibrio sp.]|uniref:phage tail tube protein n=1 Tax=Magnetovibrio sp. TaxID=2024836 RepID=UPI002F95D5B9